MPTQEPEMRVAHTRPTRSCVALAPRFQRRASAILKRESPSAANRADGVGIWVLSTRATSTPSPGSMVNRTPIVAGLPRFCSLRLLIPASPSSRRVATATAASCKAIHRVRSDGSRGASLSTGLASGDS